MKTILLKRNLLSVAWAAIFITVPIHAQTAGGATSSVGSASASELTDGEVRKVDKGAKKVTIKHGEIKSLDMPPMTMVFAVTDSTMLDKLKAGDKVRFKALDNGGGKMTVTEIQPAK
jgi:Cu(I)/Ag(I) efflux system periplasmic protein CusF